MSKEENDFGGRGLLSLIKRTDLQHGGLKCDKPFTRDVCALDEVCCNLKPDGRVCRPRQATYSGVERMRHNFAQQIPKKPNEINENKRSSFISLL